VAFVNIWGTLGVGHRWARTLLRSRPETDTPPAGAGADPSWKGGAGYHTYSMATEPLFESVAATKEALHVVQRLAEIFRAIQARDWRSPALPTLDETWRFTQGRPWANAPSLSGPERERTYWRAFTLELTKHLDGVQPTLRWDPDQRRGVPAWTAQRPLDVLYTEIWDWATEGKQIRKCPNCSSYFQSSRKNKLDCTRSCACVASVRRSRRKPRRKHPDRRKSPDRKRSG
jgi:hypothetical protein